MVISSNSLKDYAILSKLGRGSSGVVYKVLKQAKVFVLKIVPISQSWGSPERALKEVEILKSLDRPNIVKFSFKVH